MSAKAQPTSAQLEVIRYFVRVGAARTAEKLSVSRVTPYNYRKCWPKIHAAEEARWAAAPEELKERWLAQLDPDPDAAGPCPVRDLDALDSPTPPLAVEVAPQLPAAIPAGTGAAALVMALEQAQVAITKASTVAELKRVADFAAVAAAYARAERMSKEIAANIAATRVDALATMAEVWEATPHNTGTRVSGGGVAPPPDIPTLADRGLTKDDMRVAKGLLRLRQEMPDLYEAARSGRMTVTAALRAQYAPPARERPAHLRAIDAQIAYWMVKLVAAEVGDHTELTLGCDEALRELDRTLDGIRCPDRAALV